MAERWKLMSVTLISGIIATLRVTSPLTRIIRLSVTVKYVTRQPATRYRKYSRTGTDASQTISGRTARLVSFLAATRPPETRPEARMSGPASTAGCIRTVMYERSCGNRYRFTDVGTVAARLTCLIHAPAGSYGK